MSTAPTPAKTTIPAALDPRILARVLEEGYGPDAWHGPNLKAALADVTPALAFWRPSADRHSIAEIALHHAYHARAVRARVSGTPPEPFVLEGDDWFALPDASRLSWHDIQQLVDEAQRQLAEAVRDAPAPGAVPEPERFELALGITCHAVYHAGQIQLLKKIAEEAGVSSR